MSLHRRARGGEHLPRRTVPPHQPCGHPPRSRTPRHLCRQHPHQCSRQRPYVAHATGWCAYTFPGHTESDKLATCLYKAAQRHLPGHRLRTEYSDGDPDFEEPFYILKHTYCAAVLTENGFMDSEVSLSFLESEEGKKAIVALHVEGIVNYINRM